ncbi:MAG: FtsQ-type POTRA domain-containing protein [Chloroflexota bacterium]|nr:FtsQ-type POTRA domain-containing protein [Chloroflexota bacterium]
MKLKSQTRPDPRRVVRTTRGATAARKGAKPRGRQAKRPGVPLRRRLGRRLPSLQRVLTGLAATAIAAGLAALLGGPWLRVTDVSWAGEQFTVDRDLERILDRELGTSVLAVDTGSLRERLERLPAVASARVSASIPGHLDVTVEEHEVAFVWETASARLFGAADGTLFAAIPSDAALDAELVTLPRVVDERSMSRLLMPGDQIPDGVLRIALHLAGLDPVALGSEAERVAVRLDDEFGFGLVAGVPGWELAFGVYGMDPNETSAGATARLERQVTAVRTLFATRAEADIAWVDARNPGKVYFRAKG